MSGTSWKSVLFPASQAKYVKKKKELTQVTFKDLSSPKGQGQAMMLKKWKKWLQNQDSYDFLLISNYFWVGLQVLLDVVTLLQMTKHVPEWMLPQSPFHFGFLKITYFPLTSFLAAPHCFPCIFISNKQSCTQTGLAVIVTKQQTLLAITTKPCNTSWFKNCVSISYRIVHRLHHAAPNENCPWRALTKRKLILIFF